MRILSVEAKVPHICTYCRKEGSKSDFKTCSNCESVQYCGSKCQQKHMKICKAISELSFQEQKKMTDNTNFQTFLTPKHYNKLVSLVGPKSIIQCYIESKLQNILWDTGANVSLIDRSSLQQWYPDIQIRDMNDLLSDVNGFDVRWGNQSKLPFTGWVELKVSLTSNVNPDVIVPFLVTSDPLDHPILGTNTIILLTEKLPAHVLSSTFQQALPDRSHNVITQLVNLIQAERDPSVYLVKTTKQKITIPANNEISIKCRIERNYFDQSIPVAFEPVSSDFHQDLHVMPSVLTLPKGATSAIKIPIINNFSHDVNIQPKTVLGHVFQIQSVTPLERELKLQKISCNS